MRNLLFFALASVAAAQCGPGEVRKPIGSGQWSCANTSRVAVKDASGNLPVGATLPDGSVNHNAGKVNVTKDAATDSGVDITGDGTGALLRFASNQSGLGAQKGMFRTWFDEFGMLNTQGWINMHAPACTWNVDGSLTCLAPAPVDIPYGISMWADIPGPNLQMRGSGMAKSDILHAMDGNGTVRQRIEDSGRIWWGPSGTAAGHDNPYTNPDLSLQRNSDGTAGFNAALTVGKENLHNYSETLSNGVWQPLNTTKSTAPSVQDPDGSATAFLVTETAENGYHFIQNTVTGSCTGICTSSALIKYNTRRWAFLSLRWGGNDYFAAFDVQNGVLGTVDTNLTATITATRNGWYLCTVTNKAAQVVSSPLYGLASTTNGAAAYTGDITMSLYMTRLQFSRGPSAGSRATTAVNPILNTSPARVGMLDLRPLAYASLPACTSAAEGYLASVTDSDTTTYGAAIAGSSTGHVLAYCDGTSWKVH